MVEQVISVLGVDDRTAAVTRALERGLLPMPRRQR